MEMKAVLEEGGGGGEKPNRRSARTMREVPGFIKDMGWGTRMGMINMEDEDLADEWSVRGRRPVPVRFDRVSEYFEWKDLFPEWIDEEEEIDGPACPDIPMPDFDGYDEVDVVVAKLPCRFPEEGWARDVFRLQVHQVAANMAARRGRRDKWIRRRRRRTVRVAVLSKCRPMLEFLRCEDLVAREGEWWFFRPEVERLQQKLALPVGSCQLALPLWSQGAYCNSHF